MPKINTYPYNYLNGDCWLLAETLYGVIKEPGFDIYALFYRGGPQHAFLYNPKTKIAIDWNGRIPVELVADPFPFLFSDCKVKKLSRRWRDTVLGMYDFEEYEIAEDHARRKGIIQ